MAQLDLLVAVDLMQRESHRHAHWLIPAYHWTERSEMHPLIYGMPDKPFAQYWRAPVEPPRDLKDNWEFFTDLALAMGRDLFGKRGVNRFIRSYRGSEGFIDGAPMTKCSWWSTDSSSALMNQ